MFQRSLELIVGKALCYVHGSATYSNCAIGMPASSKISASIEKVSAVSSAQDAADRAGLKSGGIATKISTHSP